MKTTIQHLKKSIDPSPWRGGFLLIPLVLACFGIAPIAEAADGDLGKGNTSEGANALPSLTTGIHNTALGSLTLFSDTTGSYNTATGSQALRNNTANNNTADGFQALFFNTTGTNNAATGWRALFHNTSGAGNAANGSQALVSNTTGSNNTANGVLALGLNTTGGSNTAYGNFALFNSSTGSFNTANGSSALSSNTTGASNTADGTAALSLNTTGSFNIALGNSAGLNLTTGDNNIDIGNFGVAAEANTIRIGNSQTATFIAGISGAGEGGPASAVYINTNTGQLGTAAPSSSRRFKKEIKPMDQTSEAILGLKPVTFQYKSDSKGTPQFGLIAEEVAEVNPDLVVRDTKGEVYTVRYEAVNAMLLNEFLKEHRKVEEQEATITQLKDGMKVLTASLKEQASQIQKVSAQLEVSKPAPQTVLNNQ